MKKICLATHTLLESIGNAMNKAKININQELIRFDNLIVRHVLQMHFYFPKGKQLKFLRLRNYPDYQQMNNIDEWLIRVNFRV